MSKEPEKKIEEEEGEEKPEEEKVKEEKVPLAGCKVVVIGDSGVGKTSMLMQCSSQKFPTEHIPTDVDFEGRRVQLELHDTAGIEDYDNMRPLCYKGTDLFLLVFSYDDVNSLKEIERKWFPEIIDKGDPGTPYIIVGNKFDLKSDNGVRTKDIKKMARKINSFGHFEISSKTIIGFEQLLREICSVVSSRKTNEEEFHKQWEERKKLHEKKRKKEKQKHGKRVFKRKKGIVKRRRAKKKREERRMKKEFRRTIKLKKKQQAEFHAKLKKMKKEEEKKKKESESENNNNNIPSSSSSQENPSKKISLEDEIEELMMLEFDEAKTEETTTIEEKVKIESQPQPQQQQEEASGEIEVLFTKNSPKKEVEEEIKIEKKKKVFIIPFFSFENASKVFTLNSRSSDHNQQHQKLLEEKLIELKKKFLEEYEKRFSFLEQTLKQTETQNHHHHQNNEEDIDAHPGILVTSKYESMNEKLIQHFDDVNDAIVEQLQMSKDYEHLNQTIEELDFLISSSLVLYMRQYPIFFIFQSWTKRIRDGLNKKLTNVRDEISSFTKDHNVILDETNMTNGDLLKEKSERLVKKFESEMEPLMNEINLGVSKLIEGLLPTFSRLFSTINFEGTYNNIHPFRDLIPFQKQQQQQQQSEDNRKLMEFYRMELNVFHENNEAGVRDGVEKVVNQRMFEEVIEKSIMKGEPFSKNEFLVSLCGSLSSYFERKNLLDIVLELNGFFCT